MSVFETGIATSSARQLAFLIAPEHHSSLPLQKYGCSPFPHNGSNIRIRNCVPWRRTDRIIECIVPVIQNKFFWGGVGVGISLSLLASYETKRRRLWQRVRLKFFSWLHDTGVTRIGGQRGGTPLLKKYRKPHSILQLDGTPIPRKSETENDDINGTHLELVSPEWVPSSNLYCDVVTVPKGTELLSRKSEGVEFYYVINGDGMYVDQHGEQHQISAECGFIVDPEW